MGNCNCNNEVTSDGTGQLDRYLAALDPSYAPIDGRSFEDMLVFAKKYAGQIRFYDLPGSSTQGLNPSGNPDWKEFFERDMAVIAASIAIFDLNKRQLDYNNNRDLIMASPTATLLGSLFQEIIDLAAHLDRWYSLAIPVNPLFADLNIGIQSLLSTQLQLAIAYAEGFAGTYKTTPLTFTYTKITNTGLWFPNGDVPANTSIYAGKNVNADIVAAVPYLDNIFNTFLSFIQGLITNSEGYMEFAIKQYPAHQPYMALFIAFIKLFHLAQDQMNHLTARMLNYYYSDVLQLKPKPAVPDKAYVVFQLAKSATTYDVAQGTALSAGKDASGVAQLYQTQADFVVNQAQVTSLKTIYIETSVDSTTNVETIVSISASPVANSQDGNGAPFTSTAPKWPTFGTVEQPQPPKNLCDIIDQAQNILNTPADTKIGFAMASPQLLLQGGNRLIKLQMTGQPFTNLFPTAASTSTIQTEIWLTGANGWLKLTSMLTDSTTINAILNTLTTGYFATSQATSCYFLDPNDSTSLYIFMPIAEQGIIPFNGKIHQGYSYNTNYPVLQFLFGSQIQLLSTAYNSLTFSGLSITVQVGSINLNQSTTTPVVYDGLNILTIQTSSGQLKSEQAFVPFNINPYTNAFFYVGSNEVFNKPYDNFSTANNNIPDALCICVLSSYGDSTPTYTLSVLSEKAWNCLLNSSALPTGNPVDLSSNANNISQISPPASFPAGPSSGYLNLPSVSLRRKPIESNMQWNAKVDKGFFWIAYNLDYTWVIFKAIDAGAASASVAARAGVAHPDSIALPPSYVPPPPLIVNNISINYRSTLEKLHPEIDQFFHIYPFGQVEVYIGKVDYALDKTQKKSPSDNTPPPINIDYLCKLDQGGVNSLPDASQFNKLLALRNGLLTNAQQKLLPQFTLPTPPSSQIASNSGLKIKKPGSSLNDAFITAIINSTNIAGQIVGENNQYSGLVQEEGMLFIGVQNLQPLQSLSLLFQFASGSAFNDSDAPPTINWSYLVYDNWQALSTENIVSDTTYGFQATGIVTISVPGDANSSHNMLPTNLYWFCASVDSDSDAVPQLVTVVSQATEVQFLDQGNAASHYANALPSGTISKLAVPVAQISGVQQPFASFGGIPAEVGQQYYTRVSERLRHKNRPITPWDYERMVLNNFPQVFKVKCVTHTDPSCLCFPDVSKKINTSPSQAPADDESKPKKLCCGPVVSPGSVLIVAVPNMKNNNSDNPLEPKNDQLTLIDIEQYLQPLVSPFVTVYAQNPVYERILVYFNVKFKTGYDVGYYITQLNQEIVQYLTPWAFNPAIEASFNQEVYASAVIAHIQSMAYVDFITCFFMYVCRDECCDHGDCCKPPQPDPNTPSFDLVSALAQAADCGDIESVFLSQTNFVGDVIAKPSSPMSILVSATKHIIIPYADPPVPDPCNPGTTKPTPCCDDVPVKRVNPGRVSRVRNSK